MSSTTIVSPIGADPEAANDEVAQFAAGTIARGNDGDEYVYVKANADGIASAGQAVLLDEDWVADLLDSTNSATAFGQKVGVARTAITANYWGWVQVAGVTTLQVAASCAANAALTSSATAGQVDDATTAGLEVIDRMILTTAQGAGGAGTAAALLTHPTVGATL